MDQLTKGLTGGFDKVNAIIAGITTLISFFVYRLTVAPTLSYWDCGEFIASAHILGNPHPPGTPLFVLIGRFFDLLPIGADVAYRINMMSAVCSTFTALFAYLIIVRMVSSWYKTPDSFKLGRYIAYASGFIGALFVAFSRANWTNSVETEPRAMAIMLVLAIFWLALKWFDHRYDPSGRRIILLVAFLAMLSVGVHLTVFLVVPIVTIFFCLRENATKFDWAMVAGFFVVELILIVILSGAYSNYKIFLGLSALLFAVMAFVLRDKIYWPILISFASMSLIMVGFKPFLYGTLGWLTVTLVVFFIKRDSLWRLAATMMVIGLIGYSVHTYIPVRSSNHPMINENTPSRDYRTFVNFLDRKQYGSMSMTERMFVRRGDWSNQFGDHARMGFWRIFKDQYSHEKFLIVFLIIGTLGLGTMAYKNPRWGPIFAIFLLLGSVGLVLYMNFADGTRFNAASGDAYQEVRKRYYFFTPAFVIFGLAIGLGMGAIMEFIRKGTKKLGEGTNKAAVLASLLLILTPLIPLKANFHSCDRSNNYLAYDYAYNLLNSCDKDAILFTSGDNDTFPLWCVQEIYNLRKDVRVVNFSLLNTDWYVWQLKNIQNVPISLDNDQILWEPFTMRDGTVISKPIKPFRDVARNRQAWLIPMPLDGKLVKVAAMMLDDIILTNKWKYPIYFSSASGEVRNSPLQLLNRCYREGLVLHLTTDMAHLAYNEQRTDSLFFEIYKYRNLDDTLVSQDENSSGISLSYPEKMLDYQNYVMGTGDTARADSLLDLLCEKVPTYWRSRLTQRDMYLRRGDSIRVTEIEEELKTYLHGYLNMNPDNIFFLQFLGMAYFALGDQMKAEDYLDLAWKMNPDKETTFRSLLTLYADQRRPADMLRVAKEFKRYHNDNEMANNVIRSAQALMQSGSQPPTIAPTQPIPGQPSRLPIRVIPSSSTSTGTGGTGGN
ncbi:MAG: DUF2723 domain-containing protein [FCB group bacterium]|nr:DUF2723 domain-containing protein [FCB group bacterium]